MLHLIETRAGVRRTAIAVGALVVVLVTAALGARDDPPAEAELAAGGGGAARAPGVGRIVQALARPSEVAPQLAAEVTAIDATASGWLLLVGSARLVPDDARALCEALAAADALPPTRVFVTDADRQLVQGC